MTSRSTSVTSRAERRGDGRARVAGGTATDDHEAHRTDAGHGSRVRDARSPTLRACRSSATTCSRGRCVIVAPDARGAPAHSSRRPSPRRTRAADCPFCHGQRDDDAARGAPHRRRRRRDTGLARAGRPEPLPDRRRGDRSRRPGARGRRALTRPRPLVRAARRRRCESRCSPSCATGSGSTSSTARRYVQALVNQAARRERRSRTRTRSSCALDFVPPAVTHRLDRYQHAGADPVETEAAAAGAAGLVVLTGPAARGAPHAARHAVRAARRAPLDAATRFDEATDDEIAAVATATRDGLAAPRRRARRRPLQRRRATPRRPAAGDFHWYDRGAAPRRRSSPGSRSGPASS